MPFSLRCVQYIVTSVSRDQQYMLGVKSCLWSRKCVDVERGRSIVSTTDAMIAAVDSLMLSDWHVMR